MDATILFFRNKNIVNPVLKPFHADIGVFLMMKLHLKWGEKGVFDEKVFFHLDASFFFLHEVEVVYLRKCITTILKFYLISSSVRHREQSGEKNPNKWLSAYVKNKQSCNYKCTLYMDLIYIYECTYIELNYTSNSLRANSIV